MRNVPRIYGVKTSQTKQDAAQLPKGYKAPDPEIWSGMATKSIPPSPPMPRRRTPKAQTAVTTNDVTQSEAKARCAVVGLGNIGAAVYRDLAKVFSSVIGVDINTELVADLRKQGVMATTDISECKDIDAWIICASTGPHMETTFAIADSLQPKSGALISVESTLRVNTMHELALRFTARGYRPGQDIYLVHAPHRIMIGQDASTLSMPRVIGGVTTRCLEAGTGFYQQTGAELVPVPDVRLAELAKIVENSSRYVEVAFAEAIANYCAGKNLDFTLLRKAVNSKGNVNLRDVDYGIGGECLPKDIVFLQSECQSPLLTGAMVTDELYRADLLRRVIEGGRRVLMRGVGYKPGLGDMAYSRAVDLARKLMEVGCEVAVEDPLVASAELMQAGLTPAKSQRSASQYNVVIERGRILEPPKVQ